MLRDTHKVQGTVYGETLSKTNLEERVLVRDPLLMTMLPLKGHMTFSPKERAILGPDRNSPNKREPNCFTLSRDTKCNLGLFQPVV